MDTPLDLAAINAADEQKGAVVHSFDPNASPQDKAASVGKAADALNPITPKPDAKPVAVAVNGNGPLPAPTITISDVDKVTQETVHPDSTAASPPQPPQATSPTEDIVPGTIPDAPVADLPHWYKIGWRAAAGVDDAPPTAQDIEKSTLNQWVSDMYYGQWYHNAAIIIFAVLASHILTLLRMGWGWRFILLATCATYYSNSVARFRRNARDDIQRELVKNRLATEHETADWINNFLHRFWLIYEPVLSKTITATVDQILSYSTPSFLDSLRLAGFTLGTTAPRVEKVRTFPRTPNDIVLMDWMFKFTPTDLTDITPRQSEKRVNPKITLEVKVGKGPATATFPILVEDMSFQGHLRVKLKLMSAFPHIQIVEVSFMEKPVFDYVLKPLGGDTFGWDIGNIPGLSAFIRDMVHSILEPMMYDPNVFTLNLEQLLSGTPIDTAVGVVQVHVVSARNLKGGHIHSSDETIPHAQLSGSKIGGGTPDPYVSISINNRTPLARTGFRPSTVNPHWGSTHFILVNQNNLNETLTLTLFDHNEHRKDTPLGTASFELQSLLEDATQECRVVDIFKDGKERGELQFDMSGVIHPVLATVVKPAIIDGKPEPLPETNVGICRLVVHQAKDLDRSHSTASDLNPLAKIYLNNSKSPQYSTPTYRHTLNPVRISAEWKPLDMAGNLQGAGTYSPPIGVVRLWIKKAKDVKNVEATLGGKSDPYVRVLLNGVVKARTDIINNNLNPEWDQIIYVPVHSLRESLHLEVMDYQHLTKDRHLGFVDLRLVDLATEDPADKEHPYKGTGRQVRSGPIELDKGVFKGVLDYEAEFVPSLNLKGLEFDEEKNELEKAVDEGRRESSGQEADGEDVASADGSSGSSSDGEYEKVPDGVTIGEQKPPPTPTHTKGARSVDTVKTTGTVQTVESQAPDLQDKGAVERTREELLQSRK
ncbi:hypothetical protein FRB99_006121 [Tulasnella sp. 403]|nr:hypothetical protein FRB99_006121 [Tulasnella sp. 403]